MQLRARYAFTQLPLRKLKSAYFDGNVASASPGGRRLSRGGAVPADRFVDGRGWMR